MKEGRLWIYIIYKWKKVSYHSFSKCTCLFFNHSLIAPTLAEMRYNLLNAKMSTVGIQGSVTWLIEGISIEDAQ